MLIHRSDWRKKQGHQEVGQRAIGGGRGREGEGY
jgi:hypothetical protein